MRWSGVRIPPWALVQRGENMLYLAIQKALEWTRDLHYGNRPFFYHLVDVSNVLYEFGFIQDSLHIAAYMHDIIEDTSHTKEEIQKLFGTKIAEITWRVTDELGENREVRKAKTYPKIAESSSATIIKLADRIANVRAAKKLGDSSQYFAMYLKEYSEFKKALYNENQLDVIESMWETLDKLHTN